MGVGHTPQRVDRQRRPARRHHARRADPRVDPGAGNNEDGHLRRSTDDRGRLRRSFAARRPLLERPRRDQPERPASRRGQRGRAGLLGAHAELTDRRLRPDERRGCPLDDRLPESQRHASGLARRTEIPSSRRTTRSSSTRSTPSRTTRERRTPRRTRRPSARSARLLSTDVWPGGSPLASSTGLFSRGPR